MHPHCTLSGLQIPFSSQVSVKEGSNLSSTPYEVHFAEKISGRESLGRNYVRNPLQKHYM